MVWEKEKKASEHIPRSFSVRSRNFPELEVERKTRQVHDTLELLNFDIHWYISLGQLYNKRTPFVAPTTRSQRHGTSTTTLRTTT